MNSSWGAGIIRMAERVMVAMSGGVDSSVAALLLVKRGYGAEGVTMRIGVAGDDENIEAARSVCAKLGIKHHVLDLTDEFKEKVINEFARLYLSGRTPNPCLLCNKNVKFGVLMDKTVIPGFTYFASGHYARVETDGGTARLKKGADASKDQSYALYAVEQERLRRLLLPLGEFSKTQIRAIAEAEGLVTAKKSDSQDICFVKNESYAEYIYKHCGVTRADGLFLNLNGEPVGEHNGALNFTIGQRKGLKFSSTRMGLSEKVFVVSKDMERNTVTLGLERDLYVSAFRVNNLHFVSGDRIENPFRADVKTRYNGSECAAVITPCADGALVELNKPLRAVTPGQAAVFYDGDEVLGGGTII
jgi:tRNA-specific 2-thiouridylase